MLPSAVDLARHIDHTLLSPAATASEIERLCVEARAHGFHAVCVNGSRVLQASHLLADSPVKVAAVVGFPLGATDADAKRYEAEALIDTSVLGNQPMFSSDKKIVLLFNGEIFNYKEIRKDLEELKVTFRSHSDTEVIIEGYRHFGIEIINRFIGFFSIVLYDFNHSLVYFVRDRAGVKPFFYYLDPSCILFASELKALHCHPQFKKSLNIEAVAMFFKSGSISAPHCIFNNTFKVEPGHFIKIDLITKALSNTKYWDVFNVYNKPVNKKSL